jgi:hypothetical protein
MTNLEKNVTGGEISVSFTRKPRRGEDVEIHEIQFTPDPALTGRAIRAADAAEKYNVSDANLSRWAERGLIRVVEQAPKLLILNEADVAKAASIFNQARTITGSYVRAGYILKRVIAQQTHSKP